MSIVILRQIEHENCAKNMTGLIFQAPSTNETFDVYCYDENGKLIIKKDENKKTFFAFFI